MLVRHVLGYLPANVVPAMTAFAAVYVYTRMLSPEDYGVYSVILSVTLLCQAVFYYWLQIGATRFYARAEIDRDMPAFSGTIYKGTVLSSVLMSVIYVAVLLLWTFPANLLVGLWLGLPLVLARGLVSVNQAFNRGGAKVLRYNLVECSQNLLGLVLGVFILMVRHDGAHGVLIGLIVGALAGCAFGVGPVVRGLRCPTSVARLRALISFGTPLTACCAVGFVLNTSDRIVIQYVLGSSAVGIYSVAYNTIDRSIGSIFIAISMAAFPLLTRALEAHGTSAARKQMTANGTLLLSIVLPACGGLIAAGPQVGAVLFGAAFRQEAMQIMPWIVASALMSGLEVHYFNHAFYLGQRTSGILWVVGPAAALNVALNFLLLPRLGLMGAVYSTLIAHGVALACSIVLGRRQLRFDFPFGSALRIVLASAVMMGAIRCLNLPNTVAGLAGTIVLGIVVYVGMCFVLNVSGLRESLCRYVQDYQLGRAGRLDSAVRRTAEDE